MKLEFGMGDRIKILRKNSNLSQRALAELLGITAQTVSLYESEKRVPDAKFLNLLIERLNCDDPGWLLTGKQTELDPDKICPVKCTDRMREICARAKMIIETDGNLGKALEGYIAVLEQLIALRNIADRRYKEEEK
jgi:transcriptional regulator with XRE-family HTH domain